MILQVEQHVETTEEELASVNRIERKRLSETLFENKPDYEIATVYPSSGESLIKKSRGIKN